MAILRRGLADRPTGCGRVSALARMAVGIALISALPACGLRDTPEKMAARAERSLAAQNFRAAIVDLKNLALRQPENGHVRTQLGMALLGTGNAEEAASELGKALELHEPAEQVVPSLADALSRLGRAEEALKALDTLSADQAALAASQRLRGTAQLRLGRFEDARRTFAELVARDAGDVVGRLGLAATVSQLDGPAAAKPILDETVARAPEDGIARLALGLWYLRQGQLTDARAQLFEALGHATRPEQATHRAGLLALLGEISLSLGDVATAATELRELERLAPRSSAALTLAAQINIAKREYPAAQTALQELLAKQPKNAYAQMLMGQVFDALGDLNQAEMYLTAAVAAAPQSTNARKLLAEIRLRQSKPGDALKSVGPVTDATDPDLLMLAARADTMLGDLPAAIAILERRQSVAPSEGPAALDLAGAYLAADRASDALQLLDRSQVPESLSNRRESLRLAAMLKDSTLEGARAEAKRFAASRASDPEATIIAARTLVSAADVAGARALLKAALTQNPENVDLAVTSGLLELGAGNYGPAEDAFRRALATDEHSVAGLLGLAQIAAMRGDGDSAIQRIETARLAAPKSPLPLVALVRVHLSLGDMARAEAALSSAKMIAPTDAGVRAAAAAVMLARGQGPDAIAALDALVREIPNSSTLQTELARAQILTGRVDEARVTLATTTRADPNYRPALLLRAQLAVRQSDRAAAEHLIEQLQSSGSPAAEVDELKGDLAARVNDFATAAQAYGAALQQQPTTQLAIKRFAVLRNTDRTAARQALTDCLKRDPRSVPARLALATDLEVTGEAAAAKREYESVLARDANQVIALNNLAYLKLTQNDVKGAIELAKRAYSIAPQLPAVADTYGWALVTSNHAVDALPLLKSASMAVPDDYVIKYHYAVALIGASQPSAAREQLQQIASAAVASPIVKQAQQLLASLPPPPSR